MEALFLKMLSMSVTASYVILAVLLIRLFLRKAPKKYAYLLWSVAGFRLCSPVSFSLAVSIFSTRFMVITSSENSSDMITMPQASAGILNTNIGISENMPAASVNPLQIYILLGSIIWCTGIALLLIYTVVSFIRLKRLVATAVRLESNVYESDQIRSPFILGFMKPKIYIPFGLGEQEKAYILQHERCHLQRKDHWIKPLAFLLLAIHWFNPLVWLAFVLMAKDMEMSCDEKVLSVTGPGIAKLYSISLLSFAMNRRFPDANPLAFGETSIKERVKNVLLYKKPKRWVTSIAAVLCAIVVVACAANPKVSGRGPEALELYGSYKFEKAVYMNLLSSFHPFDGYVEYYTFSENKLVITDNTGIQRSIPAQYQKVAVETEDFKAAFDVDFGVPDITKYKKRIMYTLNEHSSSVYRLYLLDDELWLSRMTNGSFWNIYKLSKFEGDLPLHAESANKV